jgi:hypothetical protein
MFPSMATRTRTQNVQIPSGGTAKLTASGMPAGTQTDSFSSAGKQLHYAQCVDTTGSPRQDHGLSIEKYVSKSFVPLSGVLGTGVWQTTFDKFYGGLAISPDAHLSLPAMPSLASDAAKLVARTNPNSYQVQTLENLADIGDLPKLIKLGGDTILKKGAGAYLTWSFGWAPLLSDLRKLLDFQGRVNRKVKDLHRLYSKGGIHRHLDLQNANVENAQNTGIYSAISGTLTCRAKSATSYRRWGTVRYLPSSLPPRDESEYRRDAIRIVYGLELSPSAIWEALPWTWLADWFGDVGDYLVQYNNVVPVTMSTPCIMEETTTTWDWERVDSNKSVLGGSKSLVRWTKKRSLVPPGLSATMPFLSARQLSILGALFITKHRAK